MKRIKIKFKRRREGRTNYRKRISLLKSKIPRLVVRKSNRYIIAQIIKSKEAQDYVVCHANSKELEKFGWKGSFKNTGAAYLTGVLIAKKASEKKIKNVVPDLGLYRSTRGSKIYAVLKGALEHGLEMNFDTKMAPSEERIGEQTKKILEKIK